MRTTYKLLFAVALAFAQVIAPSLTGRAGGGSFLMAQDAFYVYRNDGDFNGFFFDEIVRMGYSKMDLDSVEHEVYVIQEIETEDSLYRIPLNAIDSIGFVQPEIILNPRLVHLDESGLIPYLSNFETYHDYIANTSSAFFKLAYNTPEAIVPKVGDVIANFTNPTYRYSTETEDDFGGFVIKVKSISRYDESSQWYVFGEAVSEISDIFVQLISTEKISVDEAGNVKRRMAGIDSMAGMRDGSEAGMRGAAGSAHASLIDYSGTLHRDFSPRDGITIGLEAGLGLKVGLRMAYNITTERILIKTAVDTKVSVAPAITAKASGSFEIPVDGMPKFIKSIKFPAIAPLFQTRPFPDIFVRGGGDLTLKASLPTMALDWRQVFTFDTDRYPLVASYSMALNGPENMALTDIMDISSTDLSLTLSGFVQTGIKLSANIETNDWVEKIFSSGISLDLYCGPKLEGNLSLSLAGLQQSGAYGMLKNSGIKAHACSADLEAKAKVSCLWHDPQETTFFDASKQFGTLELYLLPAFATTDAEYNSTTGDVVATIHPSRMTLMPCNVGIAIYDYQGDLIEKALNPRQHHLQGFGYDFTYHFSTLPCGRYTVRPFIEMAGTEIAVTEPGLEREVIVTPILDLREDSVNVSQNGQTLEYAFITNATQVQANAPYDFIKVTVEETDFKERLAGLKVEVMPNYSVFPRTGYVILTAGSGAYVTRDTLIVHQESDRPFMFAMGAVNYSNHQVTSHQWGSSNGTDYDKTNHSEGPGTVSFTTPLTCTRSGDIMTCIGRFRVSLDDSENGFDQTGYVHNNYTITGYKEWTCELSVDISKPAAPRILSGSCQYVYTYKNESVSKTYIDLDSNPHVWWTDTYNASIHTEDAASWNHEIPFVDTATPYNGWKDMNGNAIETHGSMRFWLGGPQNVSISSSGKSDSFQDKFYDNSNSQGDTRTDHSTTSCYGFEMGDDAYIQIYLAY